MSWSRLYESGLTDNEFRISARQVLEIVLRRLECDGDVEKRSFYKRKFIETLKLKTIPIALHTDKAKEQHYEVPTDFFLKVRRERTPLIVIRKYIALLSCYYLHAMV